MSVLLIDLLGAILIAGGVALVLKRRGRSAEATRADGQAGDPATYARRIAGTMLAAFGLALATMATLYHLASGG